MSELLKSLLEVERELIAAETSCPRMSLIEGEIAAARLKLGIIITNLQSREELDRQQEEMEHGAHIKVMQEAMLNDEEE